MLPDKTPNTMGWDIGGANVKVACATNQSISEIYQLVCPLWKGLHELHSCFEKLQKELDFSHYKHAITMTGELVDHFENRKKGVITIIDAICTVSPPTTLI